MRNLKIMIIGAGMLAMSAVETLANEISTADVVVIETADEARALDILVGLEPLNVIQVLEVGELGIEIPTVEELAEALALKVAIYTVSLPDENKIVLVKDPKGFVERAIRHKMEFIAIKPTLKDEYWELVPVFSIDKSLSFNPKTTVEYPTEEELETLRIVPVADFIRYN
jgi:hypothetical protein